MSLLVMLGAALGLGFARCWTARMQLKENSIQLEALTPTTMLRGASAQDALTGRPASALGVVSHHF